MKNFLVRALLGCTLTAVAGGILLYLSEKRNTLTLEYSLIPLEEVNRADLESAVSILDKRLSTLQRELPINTWNFSIIDIQAEVSAPRIHLSITGRRNFRDALPWLHRRGLLELHLVEKLLGEGDEIPENCDAVPSREEQMNLEDIIHPLVKRQMYAIRKKVELACPKFAGVEYFTQGLSLRTVITIDFLDEDAKRFAEITAANVGKQLAVVMNGEIQVAARIQESITGGRVELQGIKMRVQAHRLADFLRYGALPCSFRLEPHSSQK
jgi:preprotein translocase subunit SecD